MEQRIPYKIYLEEQEMPKQWYNVRADMKKKPAPILNPGTLQPVTEDELSGIFCRELAKQELDDTTPYFEIPAEIRDFYRMYRPSPLVRAYCLEERLGTPAHIYYKFEGNNTSGSHKLNSAIAQAYYAKKQGLKGVTTETGAGQWGTALSMACSYFGLDCQVYMVKCSYEQKPFRREVMRTYGAKVTPSPSMDTNVGRKINEEFPGTTGSLGCAISEAVEAATSQEGYRYVLGSVLAQVLLHQSIIGMETKAALDKYGIKTFFCSNVCAAYNRKIFDELGGFVKHTIFNEDMLFAAKAVEAGYGIAYTAQAKVFHSHDYSYSEQFHRNFDLGVSQAQHPEVFAAYPSESEGIRYVKQIIRHLKEVGLRRKIPHVILQSGFKYIGYWCGKHYSCLPRKVVIAMSSAKEYWE